MSRLDTSILVSAIDRAIDDLMSALESLNEHGESDEIADVGRALGALQTAKREAEAIRRSHDTTEHGCEATS